jgi:hypothetical protein
MSQPRFLIVFGRTSQGISSPEWPTVEDPFAVRNRLDGHWFSWRLLSGNNREIGRGASVYETELGALAAITRSQIRAELCAPMVSARPTGQWWWQLELDGERIAVSGRVYQRQRECRYNLAQFMLALPAARIPLPFGTSRQDGQIDGCVVPLHRHRPPATATATAGLGPAGRVRPIRIAP